MTEPSPAPTILETVKAPRKLWALVEDEKYMVIKDFCLTDTGQVLIRNTGNSLYVVKEVVEFLPQTAEVPNCLPIRKQPLSEQAMARINSMRFPSEISPVRGKMVGLRQIRASLMEANSLGKHMNFFLQAKIGNKFYTLDYRLKPYKE